MYGLRIAVSVQWKMRDEGMLAWLLNSKEAFCQALAASAEFNRL
jgi:hypothetical protein